MTVLMITCGQPHSPNCPLHRKFYVNFILQNIDVTRNSANKKSWDEQLGFIRSVCEQPSGQPENKSTAKHGCQINGIASQSGGGCGYRLLRNTMHTAQRAQNRTNFPINKAKKQQLD